jgi:hypothetical protein
MYKCIKSFAGNEVSMKKGDTIENLDKELAEDYIRAGFIVVVDSIKPIQTKVKEEVKEVIKEVVEKSTKKTSRKKK